jgi:hypothetical protein
MSEELRSRKLKPPSKTRTKNKGKKNRLIHPLLQQQKRQRQHNNSAQMMIRMPTMDATRNVAPPSLALLSPSLSRHDDGNDDERRRRKSGCSKNVKPRRRRASQNRRRPGFY